MKQNHVAQSTKYSFTSNKLMRWSAPVAPIGQWTGLGGDGMRGGGGAMEGWGYSQASLLSKLLIAMPNAWTAHRG